MAFDIPQAYIKIKSTRKKGEEKRSDHKAAGTFALGYWVKSLDSMHFYNKSSNLKH